eukprot:scaffold2257_cov131-Alexandrium_tamarense.AAC.5
MLPHWQSRLRHSWLILVYDQGVHTSDDVSQSLLTAQSKGIQTTSLLFAHSEIKHGRTNDGLPQCNIDQPSPPSPQQSGPAWYDARLHDGSICVTISISQ